ncbi:MAG: 16S rRNA (cytosine(1402)-N(4))-methyltransferase RsmH [Thermacetogeniaceae bacterium]
MFLVCEIEHQPVMLKETLEFLAPREGGTYVDCTLGAGGHAKEILSRIGPGGRLIGIDKDREALERARERLAEFGDRVTYVAGDFRYLKDILKELSIASVDGVLFDLGVSSFQLLDPRRGFSYMFDAPLDMRMDETIEITAADLVNNLPEEQLASLIWRYGEEKWAKRIASFIVERRKRHPFRTTGELVEVIKAAIPAAARRKGHHPAKRTFQALRIAVNDELNALVEGLRAGVSLLRENGRIVVISFHSLEDRIVKRTFLELASSGICSDAGDDSYGNRRLRILTKKPLVPTPEEVKMNPRARSAKLRAAECCLSE